MCGLQNDRNFIIKPAEKGSAVLVLGRTDYLKKVEKQLSDKKNLQRN